MRRKCVCCMIKEIRELMEELMLSEANLLAVAITRAKRQVWLSYSGKPSVLIRELADIY